MRGAALLCAAAAPAACRACADFDAVGCAARAKLQGFCDGAWGRERCCATCAHAPPVLATAGCTVPKQKCVRWSCPDGGLQQAVGASCVVAAKNTERCRRCSVVDSDTCAPFTSATRTCAADGSWDGAEPACRRFCDKTYTPPDPAVPEKVAVPPGLVSSVTAAPLTVVNMTDGPNGAYLKKKGVDKYVQKRIDVFGHWFVMFTDKCESKWGTVPPLGVANQYAQWLDWEGTGKPNNPEVFAQLTQKTNATMVMFKEDGNRAMDKFFDKFGFDEDPGPSGEKGWFHPHDVGCDETPHADPDDKNSYDNAYCEVVQQWFNEGYRPVFPDVFMDKKGSLVANAMEKNIGDCGYAYDRTFKYPHCTGKFHYSDRTCEFDCLASEYEWWSLTSLLGGQDGSAGPPNKGRCKDIADEWESCSPAQLKKNDPAIVAIMTDKKYNLPTKLAYGDYKPSKH